MGNVSFLFLFRRDEIAALGCNAIGTGRTGSLSPRRGNDGCLRVFCTRKNDGFLVVDERGEQDCCCIHHSLNQPHPVWTVFYHSHGGPSS